MNDPNILRSFPRNNVTLINNKEEKENLNSEIKL